MARILVACELSGMVRRAFRNKGHDAYSCDIEPSDDGSLYHIEGDVRDVLADEWALIIAHPPCTYMSNSGVRWLHADKGRWNHLDEAADFFKLFLHHPCKRMCIENPVMHRYAVSRIGRKHDQTIQPYEFGHPESKRTCLWLRGLPLLQATHVLEKPACGHWENQTPSGQNRLGPSNKRAKIRSQTYHGIATAMADQWG